MLALIGAGTLLDGPLAQSLALKAIAYAVVVAGFVLLLTPEERERGRDILRRASGR